MKKIFAFLSLFGLFVLGTTQTLASSLTGAINNVAGGSIDTATSILSGDLGIIIYTILGLTVLGLVISVVKGFLRKS